MSTHVFPEGEGEAERHFPCAGCHCHPWEHATTTEDGETIWQWCHEALGERRKRRLIDTVE